MSSPLKKQFSLDMTHIRIFAWLLIIQAGIALFLVLLNSLMKSNGAMGACHSWPLCYGQWVPAFDTPVFLAWSHRVLLAVSVFFLIFCLIRLTMNRFLFHVFRRNQLLIITNIALLILLSAKISEKPFLKDLFLAQWFLTISFFSLSIYGAYKGFFLIRDRGKFKPHPPLPKFWRFLFVVFLFLISLQFFLGSGINFNYTESVCTDFPTCNGVLIPGDLFSFTSLQLVHRLNGYAIFLLAVFMQLYLMRKHNLPRLLRFLIMILPTLIAMQILLGVVITHYGAPGGYSWLHTLIAMIIFTSALLACYRAYYLYIPLSDAGLSKGHGHNFHARSHNNIFSAST